MGYLLEEEVGEYALALNTLHQCFLVLLKPMSETLREPDENNIHYEMVMMLRKSAISDFSSLDKEKRVPISNWKYWIVYIKEISEN